jgi:hypothetical protein
VAAIFDASTNCCLYTTSAPFTTSPPELTFFAFVNPSAIDANGHAIVSCYDYSGNRGLHLHTQATGTGNVRAGGGGISTNFASSGGALTASSWQFVAGAFYGTSGLDDRAASRNGETWASTTANTTAITNPASIDATTIGGRISSDPGSPTSANLFAGKIAYAGIVSGKMSDASLAYLYGLIAAGTATYTAIEAQIGTPVAWWDLISNGTARTGGAGYNLTDLSGTGAVTYDATAPFTISTGSTVATRAAALYYG